MSGRPVTPSLRLRIDRLVIEGLSPAEAHRAAAAMRADLARAATRGSAFAPPSGKAMLVTARPAEGGAAIGREAAAALAATLAGRRR